MPENSGESPPFRENSTGGEHQRSGGKTDSSQARELIRAVDWARTELGEPESWPASLKIGVEIVLHSPEAMILLWGPRLLTFYNDAYLPLLGSHFRGGIGEPYPQFRDDIWDVVEPYVGAALQGNGRSVHDLAVFTRRSGTAEQAYFTFAYSPLLTEAGEVAGVLAHIYETTEQVAFKNALENENKRFGELFQQAPGFFAIGRTSDYRFEYVNDAFSELVCGRPLVGRHVAEAVPEADAQGFLALLYEVERTGEPFIGKDLPFRIARTPEQVELRYIDFIYQPIKDAAGKVTGILCSGNDVTEEHLEKERADGLQKQLLHSTRTSIMGIMAATLAHEMNQPLAAARNYLSGLRRLLTREPPPLADAVEAADLAALQVERAGEIIRRARSLLEGGPGRHEPVSIRDLVQRSITLVRAGAVCGSVELTMSIETGAEELWADQIQMEQVMANLLRNACEAMEGRERRIIDVSSSVEGNCTLVRVRDTGRGLSAEQIDSIFDDFGRSTTGGLGLGLALSRTIIEAHGGRLWAEPSPLGATFIFRLPVHFPPSGEEVDAGAA